MRLLDVKSLNPKVCHGADIPQYAILSHTWNQDELPFSDIKRHQSRGSWPTNTKETKGYLKVKGFAKLAEKAGFQYIWVDSCCINTGSSAEQGEALNAMFTWYERAAACYIYLEDFQVGADKSWTENWKKNFMACRWFTRGWTLQELIAPKKRIFVDRNWQDISKYVPELDLFWAIIQRTKMPPGVLARKTKLSEVSIATKMRWAAKRKTTREEDIAYSLLGIFDVNMHPMYGEGRKKAFLRLEAEIMRTSTDETIFAWKGPDPDKLYGLLAESPDWFVDCQDLREFVNSDAAAWEMNNRGLNVALRMSWGENTDNVRYLYRAYLNYLHPVTKEAPSFLLVRTDDNTYARLGGTEMLKFTKPYDRLHICVPQEPRKATPPVTFRFPQGFGTSHVFPCIPCSKWDRIPDGIRCEHPVYAGDYKAFVAAVRISAPKSTDGTRKFLGNVVVCLQEWKVGTFGWWACLCTINETPQTRMPEWAPTLDRKMQSPKDDDYIPFTVEGNNNGVKIAAMGYARWPWWSKQEIVINITVQDVKAPPPATFPPPQPNQRAPVPGRTAEASGPKEEAGS